MKYSSSTALIKQRRAQRLRLILVLVGLFVVLALVGLLIYGGLNLLKGSGDELKELEGEVIAGEVQTVERMRLLREEIPAPDFAETPCVRMFCDSNDVQLESAMALGLKDPDAVMDLDKSKDLVRIYTNNLYFVDTMTHSKPYLVPDAVLMLWYIGQRFQEVLAEKHHDDESYRFIVTSALRSNQDVSRLRRRNGNASENSCHRYGTTIDITYANFLRSDGELVGEEWLKMALAEALYELRFEGICYVKYEYRQPCFHITLRNTQYEGPLKSTKQLFPDVKYQLLQSKVRKGLKIFS